MAENTSIYDAEMKEIPELRQFEVQTDPSRPHSVMTMVDGHYLFMNGLGQHSWGKSPNASIRQDHIKAGDPSETPTMKDVREKIEGSKAYRAWIEIKG